MFENVFKDRRVLVTGHTGFKGSWLALWLHSLGAKVAGYSLEPPTDPALFDILGLAGDMKHVIGDVSDGVKLQELFREHDPEIVLHLAAQPLVRLSYEEPLLTYQTNVMGLLHVLEAARKSAGVRAVLNVTSDKCYENNEWVYGYRETDPMGGYDPYSSSKGCAELVTRAYRNSYFNPERHGRDHNVVVASARAGNVIGGGDWALDRLVPDCARSIAAGRTITIRSPDAVRPWQHVLEPLSGYLWLAALMFREGVRYGDGWNFGPVDADVLTVEDIVSRIIGAWGDGAFQVESQERVHEARLLKLDISRARHSLRWEPVFDAKQAILETVNWYRAFYQGAGDMRAMTLDQINAYVDHARSRGLAWAAS